jgi:hypothetical protein
MLGMVETVFVGTAPLLGLLPVASYWEEKAQLLVEKPVPVLPVRQIPDMNFPDERLEAGEYQPPGSIVTASLRWNQF